MTQSSVSKVTSVINRSGAAALLSALVVFFGCSSSHSLRLDAAVPVYFGNAPPSELPLDTVHAQFVNHVLVATSHVKEKEKVVQGKSTTLTREGSEGIVGDASVQVADVLEHDPDRFIGNSKILARVEVYVPLTSYLTEFLSVIFMSQSQSEGLGEASSETIEISGTAYKTRKANR
jgi:hypothetical protein